MCSPQAMGAADATLGVAKDIMGFVGQQQAYHDNRIAANLQYANTSNIIGQQAEQTNVKQSQDTVSNIIDAAQRFGRIASSATSIGLGAGTVGAARSAGEVISNRRQGVIDFNSNSERLQLGNEQQGANLKRTSQINSVPKANILGLGLDIAGSAMGGAQTYYAAGGKQLGSDIANNNWGLGGS